MSREFDLLDGGWYAGQPYDDWAWMREHAPGVLGRRRTRSGRSPATTTCSRSRRTRRRSRATGRRGRTATTSR